LEQLQWSRPSSAPSQNHMLKCKSNNEHIVRPSSIDLSTPVNSIRGGSSWRPNRISKSAPVSTQCSSNGFLIYKLCLEFKKFIKISLVNIKFINNIQFVNIILFCVFKNELSTPNQVKLI